VPRVGLRRDVVVALALEVLDDGGELTLAAVAARAGVAVPSLYKHVEGLADLRRAVAVVCLDELTATLTAALGGAGRLPADRVRALATATRDLALRSPGRYTAVQGSAWAKDPDATGVQAAARAPVRVIVEALAGLDLPPERAVDAVRAFRATVHGFVVLELDGGFGLPDDVTTSFEQAVDALVAGLAATSATAGRRLAGPPQRARKPSRS